MGCCLRSAVSVATLRADTMAENKQRHPGHLAGHLWEAKKLNAGPALLLLASMSNWARDALWK